MLECKKAALTLKSSNEIFSKNVFMLNQVNMQISKETTP